MDYLEAFVEESRSLITELNNLLLELEKDPNNVEVMNSIFRIAHTLKGNSAAMGFDGLSELAHAIEDLLDALRQGKTQMDDELMNAIFNGVDMLEVMLNEVMEAGEPQSDPDKLIAIIRGELEKRLEGKKTEEETETKELRGEGIRVTIKTDPNSMMKGIDAMIILKNIEEIAEITDSSPSREEIEDGKFGESFQLLAKGDVEKIKDALSKIPQVHEFSIEEIQEGQKEAEAVDDESDEPEEEAKEEPGKEKSEKTEKGSKRGLKSKVKTPKSGNIQSVRVSVQKLDDLMNLVEELVVRKLKLENSLPPKIRRSIEREFLVFERVISRLQDTVMELRLIPLKYIVDRFPRMVRDLSQSLGKEVEFEIIGSDVTVDRIVLDKIQDPLVHLIRNAIDHGIEPPDVREKTGKSRVGKVRLVAEKMRDHVLIEISDDGKGLDVEKIKKRAVEKGIITKERAEEMSDEEAYYLIFEPGFSTAEKVTDVSGRGVGMDIVMSTVRSLGGSVEVKSEKGKGTTIRLRLPLTMAIVQILIVKVGDEKYGIPIKDIVEVKPISRCEIRTVGGSHRLITDNGSIPVVHLSEALGGCSYGERMIIVVSSFEKTFALACDDVLTQKEVVVKSLGGVLKSVRGISGVSILGEGDVIPILDVNTL